MSNEKQNDMATTILKKNGTLQKKYSEAIQDILTREGLIHPLAWNRSKGRFSLTNRQNIYMDIANFFKIIPLTGNDSPRGGKTGYFIRFSENDLLKIRGFFSEHHTK
jgi:hypothetical protein